MTKPFKVNLAATVKDESEIRFPVYASPKLDGIRCYIKDGVAYSRANKPLPNNNLQVWVRENAEYLEGLDGEIIVGSPTADDVYRTTVSAVMSEDVKADFEFYVFDVIMDGSYSTRTLHLRDKVSTAILSGVGGVILLEQITVLDAKFLQYCEQSWLKDGYEGVILRNPEAKYKQGRSTMKGDQGVMKLKRFEDAEAVVIDFEEQMFNGNEATVNELGHTSRSSHKANLIPKGTLGALVCETADGIRFKIGTGFDDETKQYIWDNQSSYLGKLVKYKFFPVGVKEAPRHPVFLGWRSTLDI